MPGRNPDWTEEEMILGLAVYKTLGIGSLSKERKEILDLSELLNRLPIHPSHNRAASFRNPAGVVRRLNIFREIESARPPDGSKKYQAVWQRFSSDPSALRTVASQILAKYGEDGA